MADTNPMIVGPIGDELFLGGARPAAFADEEYLAGGFSGAPITWQSQLSSDCDDLSRDLGFEVYEMMLNDPTVASAVWVLFSAALNGKFSILPRHQLQPGEELDKVDPAERALIEASTETAEFMDRQVLRQERPIKEFLFEMAYGVVYGAKLAEKVFEPGEGDDADRVCLRRLRTKRRKAWQHIVDPFGNVVAIRGTGVGGKPEDFPPQKFVIFCWTPQDGDPRGRSLLRAAYNGWNLKINSWPKLYKYLDRFGTPITVGTAAPDSPNEEDVDASGNPVQGTSIPATRALGNQLSRLEGGSWIALRAGATVEIFSPTGNGEAFLHAIQIFKREILEGILMTARGLLEAEHGSKADTQEAHHVVARLIGMLREALAGTMEHQVFRHLVELNWGKERADRHTPIASLGEVEKKDIAAVLTAFGAVQWVPDPSHFPQIDAMVGLAPRKVKDGEPIRPPVKEYPPEPTPGQPAGAAKSGKPD